MSRRIDLARLARPEIPGLLLDVDEAHAAALQWLETEYGWTVTRDASDPAWRITRLIAAREALVRRAVSDAVAQTTLAYATGAMLDHIGITYYALARLPDEQDDAYRYRLADALELYAVGLSGPWYEQTALSVPGVADARVTTPAPGSVTIYVRADPIPTNADGDRLYASDAQGTPTAGLLDAVRAVVTAAETRQQTDIVAVSAGGCVWWDATVTLTVYPGPDTATVLAAARAALASLAARVAHLGGSISKDLIAGACIDPAAVRSAAITLRRLGGGRRDVDARRRDRRGRQQDPVRRRPHGVPRVSVVPAPALLESERRLDTLAGARLGGIDADLPARLWDADRVPVEYLPLLAWALSADGWWADATEIDRRLTVRSAVHEHRRKGTAAGVTGYLDAYSASYVYTERPAGRPYTASINIENSTSVPPDIRRRIEAGVKRASVHIAWSHTGVATAPLRVPAGADAIVVAPLSLTY